MQLLSGATVPVPLFAVTLTVAGSFPLPYQVVTQPGPSGWGTTVDVDTTVADTWTATFSQPAPAGATLQYFVVSLAPEPIGTGASILAGSIVNNVRDEIPDPIYVGDVPQPDSNGPLFRASTLYRWLDRAVGVAARLYGAIITDWTAVPQRALQPWYAVDPKFTLLRSAFSNQWPIDTLSLSEDQTIWPSTTQTNAQSLWGFYRKRSDHLEFGLWPTPNKTDPTTTLTNAIGASGVDPILVGSTLNWLSFGYMQIDAEIIQYQFVPNGTSVSVISRGVCGTTQAPHNAGAGVQHLGLWLKGQRIPGSITSSLSVVELPGDLIDPLETYLLGRCRRGENEHDEGRKLMQEFQQACMSIRADPFRKETGIITPYGERPVGPLYGRNWGTVVR